MFESGNASSIPLSPPYELVVSGRFENGATHEALTLPESIYYLSTCWVSDWRILKCFSIRKKDESAELSWGQRCTLHAGGELLDVSLLWNIQKNEETKSVSWFPISWSAVWGAGPSSLLRAHSKSVPCSTWMLWGLETRHIFSWVPFRFYRLTFQKPLQPCKFRECHYIKEVGSYQFSNANIWRYFYVVDILQQESSVIESKRQSLKRLGFDLLEGTFKRVSSRFVNGATHKALTLPN